MRRRKARVMPRRQWGQTRKQRLSHDRLLHERQLQDQRDAAETLVAQERDTTIADSTDEAFEAAAPMLMIGEPDDLDNAPVANEPADDYARELAEADAAEQRRRDAIEQKRRAEAEARERERAGNAAWRMGQFQAYLIGQQFPGLHPLTGRPKTPYDGLPPRPNLYWW